MPKTEDRKLTPKENYLRMLTGQEPEWVPVYTYGAPNLMVLPDGGKSPTVNIEPGFLPPAAHLGGTDCWGAEFIPVLDVGGAAAMPKPGFKLFEDVCEWEQYVHAPDLSGIDWAAEAENSIAFSQIDRSKQALEFSTGFLPFQCLVNFMGFQDALMAVVEEPDAVKALLEYLTDFYVEVTDKLIDHLKPDMYHLWDDICMQTGSFFSEEVMRDIFLPQYKRLCQAANDRGIPIQQHECGIATNMMQIMHDEVNVVGWDPAQTYNDLVAFQEKNGRDISIIGAYDAKGRLLDPDVAYEEIYESIKKSFELYARDGGFAFNFTFVGPADNQNITRKNADVVRAATELGNIWYD